MISLLSVYKNVLKEKHEMDPFKKMPLNQEPDMMAPGMGGHGVPFMTDLTGDGDEPGQGSSWNINGVDGLSRADHPFDREDVDDEMPLSKPVTSEEVEDEKPDFMKEPPVGSPSVQFGAKPSTSGQRVFYTRF